MLKRLLNSDLSSVTKDNYIQTIQKLEDEFNVHLLDILLHPAEYIPKINALSNNPSSIRTFYVAILAFFKYDGELKDIIDEYEDWVGEFERWNELYLKEVKTNKPSQRQQVSYLPFKEIKNKLESLKVGDDRMVLAMYTLIPPLRSDYGRLKIYYNHLPAKPEDNYLLLKKDGGLINISAHKTAKSVGTVLQKVPEDLFKEIKNFLEASILPREYLFENKFGIPFEKNDFSKFVSRRLTHIFGKPMSINTLRHSYINSMDFNGMSIREKESVAEKMGHGVSMQDRYRLLMG